MNPKSLYRAALLEYLFYVSLAADPAEARAAYRTYRQLAKKGCPDSWFGLGRARHYGYGVKANREKAEKYYRRAAKLGHADAQESLGRLYDFAEKPDYRRARKWYARAAAQRSSSAPDAAYRLGYLYEKGLGGKKDMQTACRLYRKAAKNGHADAQRALGYLYEKALACHKTMPKPAPQMVRTRRLTSGCHRLQQHRLPPLQWQRRAPQQKPSEKMVQTRRPRGLHHGIIQPRYPL